MLTVRIQEKNHSESIMVLKLKDGYSGTGLFHFHFHNDPLSVIFLLMFQTMSCLEHDNILELLLYAILIFIAMKLLLKPLTICQKTQYNISVIDKN